MDLSFFFPGGRGGHPKVQYHAEEHTFDVLVLML